MTDKDRGHGVVGGVNASLMSEVGRDVFISRKLFGSGLG